MAAEEAADISGGATTKAPVQLVPHEGNVCIDVVGEDFIVIALLVLFCGFMVLLLLLLLLIILLCLHLCIQNSRRLGSHMQSLVRLSRCMAGGMWFT